MNNIVRILHREPTDTVKEYTFLTLPNAFVKEFDDVVHMKVRVNDDGDLVYSPVR